MPTKILNFGPHYRNESGIHTCSRVIWVERGCRVQPLTPLPFHPSPSPLLVLNKMIAFFGKSLKRLRAWIIIILFENCTKMLKKNKFIFTIFMSFYDFCKIKIHSHSNHNKASIWMQKLLEFIQIYSKPKIYWFFSVFSIFSFT